MHYRKDIGVPGTHVSIIADHCCVMPEPHSNNCVHATEVWVLVGLIVVRVLQFSPRLTCMDTQQAGVCGLVRQQSCGKLNQDGYLAACLQLSIVLLHASQNLLELPNLCHVLC